MCRNIKTLSNFDPPATNLEIEASALQYVRKISGTNKPSQLNQAAFDRALNHVQEATRELVDSLIISSPPKNREQVAQKAREKNALRFKTINR